MSKFTDNEELLSCPAGYDCKGMMQTKSAIAPTDCENWKNCSKIANDMTEDMSEDAESFTDIFERIFSTHINRLP